MGIFVFDIYMRGLFPYTCIVNILAFDRVNFKTSNHSALVSIHTDQMNSLREVKKEINKQTKGKEITITFTPVPEAHFSAMVQR